MLASLFALLPLLALASASPITERQSTSGYLINSGRKSGQCLSVEGGRQAVTDGKVTDGTPIVTVACGDASFWDVKSGSGSLVVSGTKFALDIGHSPANNGPLKSYPTAPQQTWYLTEDGRLAHAAGSQCVDHTDNGPQTWICSTGNKNQSNLSTSDDSGATAAVPAATTSVAWGPSPAATTSISRADPLTTGITGGPDGTGVTAPAASTTGNTVGPDGTGAAGTPGAAATTGVTDGPEGNNTSSPAASTTGVTDGPEGTAISAPGASTTGVTNGPNATGGSSISTATSSTDGLAATATSA